MGSTHNFDLKSLEYAVPTTLPPSQRLTDAFKRKGLFSTGRKIRTSNLAITGANTVTTSRNTQLTHFEKALSQVENLPVAKSAFWLQNNLTLFENAFVRLTAKVEALRNLD